MEDDKVVIIHKQSPWGIHYSEDNLLIEYLSSRFNLKIISWENVNPISLGGHTVFLRCPDGYLTKIEEFKKWYTLTEKYSKKVINPSCSVLYGLNKKYIFSLSKASVKIVPSILISSNSIPTKQDIPWKHVIIKPIFGEGGVGVKLLRNPVNRKIVEGYIARYGDCLVQQYFPEVISFGEISTYFINGKYIYSTISKTPSPEEYKVSWEHTTQYSPEGSLITLAKKVFNIWPHSLNYARLDWLKSGDSYFLSEFEVIDPMFNINSLNDETKNRLFKEIEYMLR